MATAVCDGIATRYEVLGDGPPLLLFSPGGFNATLDNWRTFSIYERLRVLDHLSERYTCIAYDRREAGRSGGRVECVTWGDYVAQAAALLDELGVERAHLMGGCIGCSIAAAFAVAHPERTASVVLYSPAGGPRYRLKQHERFAEHAAYAAGHGLAAVAELARGGDATFSQDPRTGPWAGPLRTDDRFAAEYAALETGPYVELVERMARTLFDRDTVPGAEPEELMTLATPALVVPGEDTSHAPSAARYLQECLAGSEYWDVPVAEQTEETAPARVLQFLRSSDSPRSSAAI